MITPDVLLKIAIHADAEARLYANPHESYPHRLARDKAMKAAEEMEEAGVKEAVGFGEFDSISYAKGEKVRLKKGAAIRSTNPKLRGTNTINAQNRTITVYDVLKGYTDICGGYPCGSRNTVIHWVGSGSYWYWTDINNVEKL